MAELLRISRLEVQLSQMRGVGLITSVAARALEEARRAKEVAMIERSRTKQLFQSMLGLFREKEGVTDNDSTMSFMTGAKYNMSAVPVSMILQFLDDTMSEMKRKEIEFQLAKEKEMAIKEERAELRRANQLKAAQTKALLPSSKRNVISSTHSPMLTNPTLDVKPNERGQDSDAERTLRLLSWPRTLTENQCTRSCLLNLPTVFPSMICEEELLQVPP